MQPRRRFRVGIELRAQSNDRTRGLVLRSIRRFSGPRTPLDTPGTRDIRSRSAGQRVSLQGPTRQRHRAELARGGQVRDRLFHSQISAKLSIQPARRTLHPYPAF